MMLKEVKLIAIGLMGESLTVKGCIKFQLPYDTLLPSLILKALRSRKFECGVKIFKVQEKTNFAEYNFNFKTSQAIFLCQNDSYMAFLLYLSTESTFMQNVSFTSSWCFGHINQLTRI